MSDHQKVRSEHVDDYGLSLYPRGTTALDQLAMVSLEELN